MWINDYTGELYNSIFHAVVTMVKDAIYYPKCRTWKAFKISRYK